MPSSHFKDNRSASRRVADGSRRTGLRILMVLLLVFGTIMLLFPLSQLGREGSPMLWPDTKAWLRFGSAEDVPTVEQVRCVRYQYGTGGLHPRARTRFECDLMLGRAAIAAPVAPSDPYAGLTKAQADSVFQQIISSAASPLLKISTEPSSLAREVPMDMSGELPVLRRLSAPDAPAEYGVVWGTGEILLRWGVFAMDLVAFWGFGILCLVAARVAWRKAQR